MKFINYILSVIVGLMTFSSCDDLDKTTAYAPDSDQIVAPVLSNPGNIYITDDNKEEEVTFHWTAANFGYQAEVSYTLYASYNGGEWVTLFENITDLNYSSTKDAFNVKLCSSVEDGGMGIPEYETVALELSIGATVGSGFPTVYSAKPLTVNVTTAKAVVETKKLYVPGSHQGWAPSNAQVVLEEMKGTDIYTGYIDLITADGSDAEFKFTSEPSWDGTNYGGSLDALDNDGGAGNLKTPSGFYQATVDIPNMKATLLLLEKVGLMGTFNNWDDKNELFMTYDPATKTYSATATFEADGEFKIRFNSNWDLALGGDIEELASGSVPNLKVGEAGTYLITYYYNTEKFKYCLRLEKQ